MKKKEGLLKDLAGTVMTVHHRLHKLCMEESSEGNLNLVPITKVNI